MDTERRGVRIDHFTATAKWVLALIAVLAVASVVLTVASIGDARRQVLDAVQDLKRQMDVLKDQNHWSMEDRRDLHESQGQIREALKRLESRR